MNDDKESNTHSSLELSNFLIRQHEQSLSDEKQRVFAVVKEEDSDPLAPSSSTQQGIYSSRAFVLKQIDDANILTLQVLPPILDVDIDSPPRDTRARSNSNTNTRKRPVHHPILQRTMTSNVLASPFGAFEMPFPWCTPAVDSLICALDARNIGTPEIVRRVKKQFPSLANVAIPAQVVEKRILILDQMVDIDYFKGGLGIGGRDVETGVGESRGVKHGLMILGDHGEAWEEKDNVISLGRAITKSPRKTISLESIHPLEESPGSRRGIRHGLAIHADHGEKWEVLSKMRAFGLERTTSVRGISAEEMDTFTSDTLVRRPLSPIPRGSYESDASIPPPLSPARSDENGRPAAVDHSIRKMRSFNDESPSKDRIIHIARHRPSHIPVATSLKVSPPHSIKNMSTSISIFPKVPEHQRPKPVNKSHPSLQDVQSMPKGRLTLKTSALSLGKSAKGKVLQKKNVNKDVTLMPRPVIHITKPSQERAEVDDLTPGLAVST